MQRQGFMFLVFEFDAVLRDFMEICLKVLCSLAQKCNLVFKTICIGQGVYVNLFRSIHLYPCNFM